MNETTKTTDASVADSRNLLIVDDEPMIAQTMARIARRAGLRTNIAHSMESLLDYLQGETPEILVLDLMMPRVDGVQVMTCLSELGYFPDLIIVSGLDQQVLDSASRSAEMLGFRVTGTLTKPFKSVKMERLLEQSMQSRAAASDGVGRCSSGGPVSKTVSRDQLNAAIETSQIEVALQPKIFCKTGTLAGFEALARWSLEGKPVAPDQFIQLAEDEGLIDDLTELVFEKAVTALNEVVASIAHAVDPQQLVLAINLSVLTLSNTDLFERISDACSRRNVDPRQIIFELTESSAMKESARSLSTLTRLRIQGFKLSIDDFGTGYSSMVQLVRLPFSEIKVDRSFVMNASTCEESRALIGSVVQLGQSLGLQTTAEGIEDQETLDYLRSVGCDQAQGYAIGKPMRASEIENWFRFREWGREKYRVRALRDSGLLGGNVERRFERLTELSKAIFDMPVSLITLLDDSRQRIKAGGAAKSWEVPRKVAICNRTIQGDGSFVFSDRGNQMVGEDLHGFVQAGFRFYAGHPVSLAAGEKVGALCLIDVKPRDFTAADRGALASMANYVEKELQRGSPELVNQVTGLYDRRSSIPRLQDALKLALDLNVDAYLALITLQVPVSTTTELSAAVPNDVLAMVSESLVAMLPVSDLIGHLRGGEFAVLRLAGSGEEFERQLAAFQDEVVTQTTAANLSLYALAAGVVRVGKGCKMALSDLIDDALANSLERQLVAESYDFCESKHRHG